ncbi:hypothetical protein BpHYR1_014747 [Brachionus plicatilis]|uniref:Uncharacterized protein n=1 Tax=Brachionus plicatilis TaxID=10195 RepID=A0A3M7S353_BRAPC|nr:hypothetical protein BpHYR1_014747 [Brachionus plicatilis]
MLFLGREGNITRKFLKGNNFSAQSISDKHNEKNIQHNSISCKKSFCAERFEIVLNDFTKYFKLYLIILSIKNWSNTSNVRIIAYFFEIIFYLTIGKNNSQFMNDDYLIVFGHKCFLGGNESKEQSIKYIYSTFITNFITIISLPNNANNDRIFILRGCALSVFQNDLIKITKKVNQQTCALIIKKRKKEFFFSFSIRLELVLFFLPLKKSFLFFCDNRQRIKRLSQTLHSF